MNDKDVLFIDHESYCEVPINRGTHAYAEEAELMVTSYAFGMTAPAEVVDHTAGQLMPTIIKEALADPAVTLVGQNYGNFDRNLLRYAEGIHIPPERIHDTMIQAMSHGLPGGLDKLGQIFNVAEEDAKMKEGKALIQLFCKPRPKNMKLRRATRLTHPIEWRQFLDYAKTDITAMRHIYNAMPRWNYPGDSETYAARAAGIPYHNSSNQLPSEFRLWCLDQRINDRGFKVDLELAEAAVAAVTKAQRALNSRTEEVTSGEVERTTQRDRLLRHLMSEYGYELLDMTKSTLTRALEDPDLPPAVRELIAIRLEVSQTSNSKYNRLLNGSNSDGRLRGTLQFCGATRTGRWAGRVFQPQNLPRPDMKNDMIEAGIAALKGGYAHLLFDSPISVASNAIRGSIVAAEGKKLVVADLSNIEGRMLAWLAGEEWKLKAFREYDEGVGPDLYRLGYSRSFNKPLGQVTDDDRQIGKVQELALGYQGAAGAFGSMAALYGIELEEAQVWNVVRAWRDANAAIVDFWEDMQRAAWAATQRGGTHRVGKIVFERWRSWLKMHLPSERVLCYADPQIIPDPRRRGKTALSYMGLNSYTRRWERLTTYGGKLVENATQAAARDVLAHNMELAEERGFPIILTVHDEFLTEPNDDVKYSVDKLAKIMARVPDWADESLPLAAAGFEGYRYRKD